MSISPQTTDALALAPAGLLIGGHWESASAAGVIDVYDPSTAEVVAQVPDAGVPDAVAAVDAAARAGNRWATVAPRRRAEVLRRAFELMMERAEPLARLITIENGKALRDARAEVSYAAEFFRWYAEEAVRADGQVSTAPVRHQPDRGAAPAGGRVRAGDAVELPGRHGHPQDRPGAWRPAARRCSSRPATPR